MKSQDRLALDVKIKQVLEYSAIDPATRGVLEKLIALVADYAESLSKEPLGKAVSCSCRPF